MSLQVQRRGDIAILTLANPGKKNAVSWEDRLGFPEQLRALAEDGSVRAVVLAGDGEDFCSGSDVSAMSKREMPTSRHRMHALHRMVLAVYQLEKPVVAAVRGVAAGVGWSLALACDAKVAGESARFCQSFGRIALAPDGGSAWFLARELGTTRAKELMYSSRLVGASEALALGLVNEVTVDDAVLDVAVERARVLASIAPYTFALTKQLVHATHAPPLEQFLELERLTQPQLSQTDDHQEAVSAFREKRTPRFSGR